MTDALPWRGPGPGRPQELPLPPRKLPVRRGGRLRKQWRYAAAFADELMICAARVRVGPLGQTFWAVCDRETGQMWERTRMRLPGARGEVWTEVEEREGVRDHAPDAGATVRIDAEGESVRAFMRYHGGTWVESVCPTPEGQYVWTRKRVGAPVSCDVRIGDRRWRVEARGVEDESEGYHPRHTVWSWSAAVGRATDGRAIGWNLVSGVNDPPERSERAVWVDGEPFEPAPVRFEELDAIEFDDGARLVFSPEFERRRAERLPLVRYSYRQPFGSFTGSLPGGIEVDRALGVMEYHDATW
jgi:Domain of unknown function (DUF2804), C-terminal